MERTVILIVLDFGLTEFQDSVFWAWLDIFFHPLEVPIREQIISCHFFFRFNTLKDNAIENTANHNAGKPLNIGQQSTKSSHRSV